MSIRLLTHLYLLPLVMFVLHIPFNSILVFLSFFASDFDVEETRFFSEFAYTVHCRLITRSNLSNANKIYLLEDSLLIILIKV